MGEYASILHNCRYQRLRLYRQQLCNSIFAPRLFNCSYNYTHFNIW